MSESALPSPVAAKGALSKSKWHAMLQHLLDFKAKHGHTLVPNRYPESPQLGSWVSTQRRQYKLMLEKNQLESEGKSLSPEQQLQSLKGSPMTEERAKILTEIGFVWSTKDPRHVPWETRLAQLAEFKLRHGHCLVPIKYPPNPQLSNWVSAQRQEYKLMKSGRGSSRLTEDKIETLDRMGFVWEAQRGGPRRKHHTAKSSVESPLLKEESCQTHSETNNESAKCLPLKKRRRFEEDESVSTNESLESVVDQRSRNMDHLAAAAALVAPELPAASKKSKVQLSLQLNLADPTAKASEASAETDIRPVSPTVLPSNSSWDERYQELVEYKAIHGDTLVPAYSSSNPRLSNWVSRQRQLYKLQQKLDNSLDKSQSQKEGKKNPYITEERIELLNALGFVWDVRSEIDGWKERLEELKKYRKKHGNVLVPNRYPENPQLGKWVSTQRRQYKLLNEGGISSMNQARIEALSELGFVWEVRANTKKNSPQKDSGDDDSTSQDGDNSVEVVQRPSLEPVRSSSEDVFLGLDRGPERVYYHDPMRYVQPPSPHTWMPPARYQMQMLVDEQRRRAAFEYHRQELARNIDAVVALSVLANRASYFR